MQDFLNRVGITQEELDNLKDLTLEEYTIEQCKWENDNVGNLNEEDGIDCPICKNKGRIFFVEKNQVLVKNCQCMSQRKVVNRLNRCGISKKILDRLTFDTFETNEEWQKKFKDKMISARNEILNGERFSVCVSSISGSGKTHLCTALFQDLIKNGFDGEYILWNDFSTKLSNLKNSSYTDNQEKYQEIMKRITNVDVLYIDDLFKLVENEKQDISSIYNVLNNRINACDKITIISTEFSYEEFERKDMATSGRLWDSCLGGKYWIRLVNDPKRNYRLYGKKENE